MSYIGEVMRALAGRRPVAPRAVVQAGDGGRLITTSADLANYLLAGRETSAGVAVTPETAMTVAAVYASVRIISGAISTMALGIKRHVDERTREDVPLHPVSVLLRRRPNRWMTPSGFRRMMTAHCLLRGNGYAAKVRLGARITELIPMHPDRVRVEQDAEMRMVYRYTKRDGSVVVMPQEDVFHLIGLSFDGVTGVSPITYARESIGVALATERHGANVFKNGTNIGGVLKHPQQLGDEAVAHLRESLEAFRGADNAGKNLILEEGMDYTPLGMSAEDAQYIQTRQFTRGEIAMFFGVPPHMIGDTEKSTSWGTGIEQQSLGFVAYTLQDWLTAWEDTINRDLLASEPDVFARFNPASLVRGDIKTRYSAYATARQWGWASVNDIRELEDLNPVEGGDTYMQPLNMAPLGDEGKENEPPPAA